MKVFIFFVSLIFLISCSHDKKEIAFYHWKSRCEIKKDFDYPLYVKVLDISKAKVIKTSCKKAHIPVVYIDNQLFKTKKDIKSIVFKTIPKTFQKVQFDCDWTKSTKKRYFEFLKQMKKRYKKASVTLRLHQLKYPKQTGVPPVDSGVLMFYNMSDFLDPKTKNYVLDLEVAKSYLKDFKPYPLKLDLALPLYSMATILRYGKVVKLIDDVHSKELGSKFKHLHDNYYKVLKTHYFKGQLVYEDDVLRVDEVSIKTLKKAKEMIPFEYEKVIFFRYSNLKDWDVDKLSKLFDSP